MTTFKDTIVETFYVVSCYSCGVRFGIESQLYKRVVTDAKGSIFCPACGKLTCWQESEEQRQIKALQKKLEWEAAEVARQKRAREDAEASLRSVKGAMTKVKKRVAAGVCPCCKRTVSQLARHMKSKHPDYVTQS